MNVSSSYNNTIWPSRASNHYYLMYRMKTHKQKLKVNHPVPFFYHCFAPAEWNLESEREFMDKDFCTSVMVCRYCSIFKADVMRWNNIVPKLSSCSLIQTKHTTRQFYSNKSSFYYNRYWALWKLACNVRLILLRDVHLWASSLTPSLI